jgi:hypothetical protein
MYIHLDRDLIPLLGADNGKVIRAFSNLAAARLYGNHIVSGDSGLLSKLSQWRLLSSQDQSIYRRILDADYPKLAQLRARLGFVCHVNAAGVMPGGTMDIVRPIAHFAKDQSTAATFLLCENIVDWRFYTYVAKIFVRADVATGINISSTPIPGGGATSPAVFSHFAHLPMFLAGVVDSDRLTISGRLGEVASSFDSNGTRVLIPACCSVENFLPDFFLQQAVSKNLLSGPLLADIKLIYQNSDEARAFFPLKKKFTNRYLKNLTDPVSKNFWHLFMSSNPNFSSRVNSSCHIGTFCSKELSKAECDCVLFEGVSSKLVKNIMDSQIIERGSGWYQHLAPNEKGLIADAGKFIFNWCCAPEPLAAL